MRRRRRRLTSKSATALSLFPSLDGLLLRSSQQLAQRLLDGSWHFSDERWLDEPRTEYDERRWSSCGAASCSVPSQCSEGKTARPGVGQRFGEIQLRRIRCAACDFTTARRELALFGRTLAAPSPPPSSLSPPQPPNPSAESHRIRFVALRAKSRPNLQTRSVTKPQAASCAAAAAKLYLALRRASEPSPRRAVFPSEQRSVPSHQPPGATARRRAVVVPRVVASRASRPRPLPAVVPSS